MTIWSLAPTEWCLLLIATVVLLPVVAMEHISQEEDVQTNQKEEA